MTPVFRSNSCFQFWLAILVLCLANNIGNGQTDANQKKKPQTTDWGSLEIDEQSGLARLTIDTPTDKISLPTPFPNISRARLGTPQWPGKDLDFSFNEDASEIWLHLPMTSEKLLAPVDACLIISEGSQQFADGQIVFTAFDADVSNSNGDSVKAKAKLESHPGSHRIGFWSQADDFVHWKYKPTRTGKYAVTLTYSAANPVDEQASDVQISFGENFADQKLDHTLTGTGGWYSYTTHHVGDVNLATTDQLELSVKCIAKRGSAVMNLKSVLLTPISEGRKPIQSHSGQILLHAKDATIDGTKLRWEPDPKKQTVGFWGNPADRVLWDFKVSIPGTYEMEILQGCGKGQGGSRVEFEIYEYESDTPFIKLPHTVKDTGHWQGFESMKLGKVKFENPGTYRLRVTPLSKSGAAVMDLRQVLLQPVKLAN